MTPQARLGTSQDGFSLVGVLAVATLTLIAMAAAVPSWKYIAKDEREEELLFRGQQIAAAVERYQKDPKNGQTLPPSLEVMVKGHYLRKAFKDPMTASGKWRIIHPGEGANAPGAPAGPHSPAPSGFGFSSPSPSPSASPSGLNAGFGNGLGNGIGGTGAIDLGPIQGVASTSTEKSLRIVNGQDHYNNWKFIPGVQMVIGRQRRIGGAPGGSAAPGAAPAGIPGQPQQQPQPQPLQ